MAFPDPAYRETIPSFVFAYSEGRQFAPYEALITSKDGSHRHMISVSSSFRHDNPRVNPALAHIFGYKSPSEMMDKAEVTRMLAHPARDYVW